MEHIHATLERGLALVLAAEDWPESYRETPEEYGRMLRQEAKLQRIITQHFRDVAGQVDRFINWHEYYRRLAQSQAAEEYTVDVVIEDALDQLDEAVFMTAIYDPIATSTMLGAQSAETLYSINLGVTESTQFVQQAAKEQIAGLVGKKVTKDGLIIPNPKAEYRISTRTKEDIRQSINTSISLHEDIDTARARIEKSIKNPKRAEMIAQTEIVNAYNGGIHNFGVESGAVGKEWETVGTRDYCKSFADQGIVPLNHVYETPSGRKILRPSAHPYCRCFERLVYEEELTG